MATEKLTLTVDETAKMLGMSKPTLYKVLYSEGFPSFKVSSRKVLVSRAGLERWVQEQAAKAVM